MRVWGFPLPAPPRANCGDEMPSMLSIASSPPVKPIWPPLCDLPAARCCRMANGVACTSMVDWLSLEAREAAPGDCRADPRADCLNPSGLCAAPPPNSATSLRLRLEGPCPEAPPLPAARCCFRLFTRATCSSWARSCSLRFLFLLARMDTVGSWCTPMPTVAAAKPR